MASDATSADDLAVEIVGELRAAGITVDGGDVAVTGDGGLATSVRSVVGELTGSEPRAVVETSGDPDLIIEATQRVAAGGIVVLAGPPPSGDVVLNLYADVHARGLTLIGVPRRDGGNAAR